MLHNLFYSPNFRHFVSGFLISWILSILVFLLLGLSLKKAMLGFLYFLITPFLTIVAFPPSIAVLAILYLLFRRVGSCMRLHLRWIAYTLLFLHWAAFGFYCSSYTPWR